MKKFNMLYLFFIGLLLVSQSHGASVVNDWGTIEDGDFNVTSTTSLAKDDTLTITFDTAEDLALAFTNTVSFLDSDSSGVVVADWSIAINGVEYFSNMFTSDKVVSDNYDFRELFNVLTPYSYVITNHSADLMTTTVVTAIASTPIPAAFLLFGTVFAGLFGFKSYNTKKMAA